MAESLDDEVRRLEHELDILRSRLAIYARWSRVLRVSCRWMALAFALLVLAAVVKSALDDVARGVFFGGLAIAAGFCLWLLRPKFWSWIDIASPPVRPFSLDAAVPTVATTYVSDARLIERQIAEREARLAALRSNEARS